MPSRITPLDVKAFASHEIYRKGEQIYESQLVKHRFQTHYGLQATVRSKGNYRVEMIVDGEQLFGRCSCHEGSSPCEHQVAVLLAWVTEPQTFISYQTLRKAIREKDKNTLVDVLINLIEIFPELCQFFVIPQGEKEVQALREDVADIFDFPHTQKIDPKQIIEACQILFVRAKLLRNEGKWNCARILIFEILNRVLSLVDRQQLLKPFPENFVAEIADDYEDLILSDPDVEDHGDQIKSEIDELLAHESADIEGVFLDRVQEKFPKP